MYKRVATPTTWAQIFADIGPDDYDTWLDKYARDYWQNGMTDKERDDLVNDLGIDNNEDAYVEYYYGQHNPDDEEEYQHFPFDGAVAGTDYGAGFGRLQ